jgi:hypothetical protein
VFKISIIAVFLKVAFKDIYFIELNTSCDELFRLWEDSGYHDIKTWVSYPKISCCAVLTGC